MFSRFRTLLGKIVRALGLLSSGMGLEQVQVLRLKFEVQLLVESKFS